MKEDPESEKQIDYETLGKIADDLVRQAELIYAVIRNSTPTFPQSAKEKVRDRICLECGKQISRKETPKRGLHPKCHRKVMRAIERGEYTDEEAVASGKMAPPKRGGRKRTATSLEKELKRTAKP